jgi:ABC-type Fe3+ transport system permease subunit
MENSSKTPGGWKSRTLWAFFIFCFITIAFLVTWIFVAKYIIDISYSLSKADKSVPTLFNIVLQSLPFGAIASGLAGGLVALVGGNKVRDATRNIGKKNGGIER